MLKIKIPLLMFTSIAMSLILLFTGCSEYQLSTSSVPEGGGSVSPSGGIFKGKVTLVATPAPYYKFIGWAGAAEGDSNPLTLTMNSNKQIVAQFTKLKYNLQVQTDSPSSGMVQPSSGTVDAGIQVKATATPANGYRFDHWGGSVTGTTANPMSILMDSDKTITAYFIKQYTLQLSTIPPSGGTIDTAPGSYDAGIKVNLSVTPSFPYYPLRWEGTDNDIRFPSTVTMNKDQSVKVYFAESIELSSNTASEGIMAGTAKASPISTVPIHLNQYEWLQGEITFSSQSTIAPTKAYIQDSSGNNVEDLGRFTQRTFTFMANASGTYNVVFENQSWYWATYEFNYSIWGQP